MSSSSHSSFSKTEKDNNIELQEDLHSHHSSLPNYQNQTSSKKLVKKLGKRTKKPNKSSQKKSKIQNKTTTSTELNNSYFKNTKEHFLYMPYYPLPDLSDYVGDLIEVRIASEFLSQSNKAFIERRIWGSDIYTSDSDPVCILQHSGYFQIKDLPPTDHKGVSLYLRVSKGRATYNSSYKNGIKSKKLNNYQGHSIKPENYDTLDKLGTKEELKLMASKMPLVSEYERKKPIPNKLADNAYYTEFNMIFNLSYEMWLAYSLPAICDKGHDFKDYTSYKLKDKVLYIETRDKRYEISLNVIDHTNDDYLFEEFETYNFAEVIDPIEKDNDFMLDNPVPLEEKYIIPIFKRLDWHEFIWGENALKIKDKTIENIKCFNYYYINNSKN